MNWMENLLIIAGISLDVFGAMECQGALVAKVDKKHLSFLCLIAAAWQIAALFLGRFLAGLLYRKEMTRNENHICLILAAVIFFGLGIRLIVKAVRNERIHEHLEEHLGFKRFFGMAAATSIYTLLTGIAFGLLGTNPGIMLITMACLTIAVVVMGMYTGYHFGFEHKTKAYTAGAALLWIAGIDVILRYMAG